MYSHGQLDKYSELGIGSNIVTLFMLATSVVDTDLLNFWANLTVDKRFVVLDPGLDMRFAVLDPSPLLFPLLLLQ